MDDAPSTTTVQPRIALADSPIYSLAAMNHIAGDDLVAGRGIGCAKIALACPHKEFFVV